MKIGFLLDISGYESDGLTYRVFAMLGVEIMGKYTFIFFITTNITNTIEVRLFLKGTLFVVCLKDLVKEEYLSKSKLSALGSLVKL